LGYYPRVHQRVIGAYENTFAAGLLAPARDFGHVSQVGVFVDRGQVQILPAVCAMCWCSLSSESRLKKDAGLQHGLRVNKSVINEQPAHGHPFIFSCYKNP
jgi:hypothetical protein